MILSRSICIVELTKTTFSATYTITSAIVVIEYQDTSTVVTVVSIPGIRPTKFLEVSSERSEGDGDEGEC